MYLCLQQEKAHVYTTIVEKLHEVEKLVSAGLITLVPVILDALDFDYGPPKHSSSSCLPFSIADQSHVHQGVTYISK